MAGGAQLALTEQVALTARLTRENEALLLRVDKDDTEISRLEGALQDLAYTVDKLQTENVSVRGPCRCRCPAPAPPRFRCAAGPARC